MAGNSAAADFDRYVSFIGCEWEEKCAGVMARLEDHQQRKTSPFWSYFFKERERAHARGLDDLRVLHNYVSTLRELLERLEDDEGLALLEDLEVTCM
ncbi:N(2)-fixation sustaining protein CowN [Thalassospira sp. MA62]|nr:N(2)-fixation sustaining protein CowN [Thalassospira sp. MA62]